MESNWSRLTAARPVMSQEMACRLDQLRIFAIGQVWTMYKRLASKEPAVHDADEVVYDVDLVRS